MFPLLFSTEHLMEEHCILYLFFLAGNRVNQMENTDEKKDPEAFHRFLLAPQSLHKVSGSLELVKRVGVS